MRILVINTGSSSIKYVLFDMDRSEVLASGIAEKIGEESGILTHKRFAAGGRFAEKKERGPIANHQVGLKRIVELLEDPACGAIREKSEITAVGHRVVHGGEAFQSTTIIDNAVIDAIRRNSHLAPLHTPANLMGIEVSEAIFPDATQVAVFDTAFHQSMPMHAFLYAIPFAMYEKEKIRRYGFHGTSHSYVAEKASEYLGTPVDRINMITIHLGNGASMAALKNGKCIDTSMGMTPLAGLVMGTRSGDVDPALPFFLADHLGMSFDEIDELLNKESGLKGICGTNDMREVIEKRKAGDDRAKIAVDIYCYRIKKYIGAYFAALGHLDALVFTAGIGEHSPVIREHCCGGLSRLGILIDKKANYGGSDGIREISIPGGEVKVLVIPANEELKIAQETKRVIAQ